ncbi:DNA invertase Pin-like site-specific DNA recombinase [Alkaliphilus hydrothermalis]|uniref:DNA invertase Pin-like site-specific DNA recombinase n=2 Tax=Alkaliphilus hydrothermalis TaxID=1482730 RepID=A0ABS2NU51_9FIRM|nr:DNA invertase Pin-like site-specific DNA recombinase [Alkaliphilus hydrothermalis]
MAKDKKFKYFIVYSRDRLTRNVYEHFAIKQLFRQNKITLCYSKPGEYSTNDPDFSDEKGDSKPENYIENLIEIVLASISELESSIISSRVKLGNKTCAEKSLWPGGKIPFGYMTEDKKMKGRKRVNSILKPIPYDSEIVREIYELYTNCGYSYRELADKMNKKYPFKTWSKGSIESILRNEVYKGYIIWGRRGGRRNPGPKDKPIKSGFN